MKRRKIRRNMSEKRLLKLKRSLRKRAKKLRLGKKRTGAYVYGTLRRVRGNPAKLSNAEKIILLALAKKEGWKNYKIRRKSAKPFDIEIEGDSNRGMFGADLMLSAIANFVNWTSPAVARISDYPSMAMEGDWSGIRDSSDEKIEAIFRLYVLPKFQDRMLRGNPGMPIDLKKIKTIDIHGKLWRDKTYGNTYFASRAIINFGMPSEQEIFYPLQYGYGNSYADIPLDDIMARAGIEQRMRSAWRLRDAYGIILRQGAEYVKKAEAKAWGEAR